MLGIAILVSLIFGPTLAAALRARKESGGAREGSEVHEVERQLHWAAPLLTLDPLLIALCASAFDADAVVPGSLLGVALVVGKIVFVAMALRRLRRIRRLADEAAQLPHTTCVTGSATRISDFGVGDAWRGRQGSGGGYREAPELERLIIGDPDLAIERVRGSIARYAKLHLTLYFIPLAFVAFSGAVGAIAFALHLLR